ncbi:MAG: aspartate carbamoyltransferase regulatory subunit [Thermofilum sp.]|jgi:aspartate carbamoyltransferase regulatory subunit|uniref:aspartate carbamoyltransferase regulatory subunit n=1 Tax=Thermofilum sp. TaxID=1961369 RepID=UPI00258F803E|nr:aspartate carbamoyltransferase regulatory subunit [Thermofilum sp.]MCI4407659.1 aspartate carbamoyltransferase regulatory subunit [Thermofilum sp.]
MSEELLVRKIRDGTVIDHIPAGRALDVLKILGLSGKEGSTIAIVMNVPSKKLGRKDIVKVEGKFLEPKEVDEIALIAPTATINIVKDFRVLEKRRVQVPEEIKGLLRCPNPNCITNTKREPIVTKFKLVSITPLKLKCYYCEDIVTEEQVIQQLVRE